jgi:hypothetical protein
VPTGTAEVSRIRQAIGRNKKDSLFKRLIQIKG